MLRFYRWGLKGRFDEDTATGPPADPERLNDESRTLYHNEAKEIVDGINLLIPEGRTKLYVPDMKFNRQIGEHAGKPFDVNGNTLSAENYRQHLKDTLRGPDDLRTLESIFEAGNWLPEIQQ